MNSQRNPSERPTSYTLFVGRAVELAHLKEMVAHVPVTIVVGVAGVGKSALAHAFAERWNGVVVRQRVTDAPAAALLDDVRRQLAGDVVEELRADEDRVADIARRLATAGGLWLLDDFHRFADADQALLLEAFVRAAGSARLLATSRHAPLPLPGLADHAQVRLDPLDEAGGRALWSALDEHYGPAQGFEIAWPRSHGLPLLLRQAHAGGYNQVDPIDGLVRALDVDERALAGALALSEVPLPATALLAMRPPTRSRPALRRLVSRLVVDIDGAERCTLHDLFAAGVRAALLDDERRALHRLVALTLCKLELDPAIRVRHVCAHLLAADRPDEAADWLLQQSSELIRNGAAAELLRAIDTLPAARRPLPLRIERARALLRVLDIGRALAELRQLTSSGETNDDEPRISMAQLALLTGDVRLAHDTLVPIVDRADATPRRRTRAAVTMVIAACYLGDGDAARRRLAALERELADAESATVLPAYRAFTLWIEERDEEAAEALRAVPPPGDGEPRSYRAAITTTIFGAVLARQGRLDEAEQMFRRSQRVLSRRADALFQLELSFGRALFQLEAGARVEALELLQSIDDAARRAGYLLGTLYTGHWLARALLIVGRRAEALDLLARVEEAARARGLHGLVAGIERSRAHDPLRQILRPAPTVPSSRRSLHVRARALQAVQAAAAGEPGRARDLFAAHAVMLTPPGYALERALAHVADAATARLEGDEPAVAAALARAVAETRARAVDGFDVELPRALLDALGRLRILDAASRRLAPDFSAPRGAVVIDARTHELHHHGKIIALRGRPIVRRLLYALAARAGRTLSKESLATAAWEREYSPLQHDNPLKSNVGHLRRLVGDAGLVVVADESGYRLELPPGAVFVEALI